MFPSYVVGTGHISPGFPDNQLHPALEHQRSFSAGDISPCSSEKWEREPFETSRKNKLHRQNLVGTTPTSSSVISVVSVVSKSTSREKVHSSREHITQVIHSSRERVNQVSTSVSHRSSQERVNQSPTPSQAHRGSQERLRRQDNLTQHPLAKHDSKKDVRPKEGYVQGPVDYRGRHEHIRQKRQIMLQERKSHSFESSFEDHFFKDLRYYDTDPKDDGEKTAKEKRLLLLHEKKSNSFDSPYDLEKTGASKEIYYDARSSFNPTEDNENEGSPPRSDVPRHKRLEYFREQKSYSFEVPVPMEKFHTRLPHANSHALPLQQPRGSSCGDLPRHADTSRRFSEPPAPAYYHMPQYDTYGEPLDQRQGNNQSSDSRQKRMDHFRKQKSYSLDIPSHDQHPAPEPEQLTQGFLLPKRELAPLKEHRDSIDSAEERSSVYYDTLDRTPPPPSRSPRDRSPQAPRSGRPPSSPRDGSPRNQNQADRLDHPPKMAAKSSKPVSPRGSLGDSKSSRDRSRESFGDSRPPRSPRDSFGDSRSPRDRTSRDSITETRSPRELSPRDSFGDQQRSPRERSPRESFTDRSNRTSLAEARSPRGSSADMHGSKERASRDSLAGPVDSRAPRERSPRERSPREGANVGSQHNKRMQCFAKQKSYSIDVPYPAPDHQKEPPSEKARSYEQDRKTRSYDQISQEQQRSRSSSQEMNRQRRLNQFKQQKSYSIDIPCRPTQGQGHHHPPGRHPSDPGGGGGGSYPSSRRASNERGEGRRSHDLGRPSNFPDKTGPPPAPGTYVETGRQSRMQNFHKQKSYSVDVPPYPDTVPSNYLMNGERTRHHSNEPDPGMKRQDKNSSRQKRVEKFQHQKSYSIDVPVSDNHVYAQAIIHHDRSPRESLSPRDSRNSREQLSPRDVRGSREQVSPRDSREQISPRDSRGSREALSPREPRGSREALSPHRSSREQISPREGRSSREALSPRDYRGSREAIGTSRPPRESASPRGGSREALSTRDMRSREVNPPREIRTSRERQPSGPHSPREREDRSPRSPREPREQNEHVPKHRRLEYFREQKSYSIDVPPNNCDPYYDAYDSEYHGHDYEVAQRMMNVSARERRMDNFKHQKSHSLDVPTSKASTNAIEYHLPERKVESDSTILQHYQTERRPGNRRLQFLRYLTEHERTYSIEDDEGSPADRELEFRKFAQARREMIATKAAAGSVRQSETSDRDIPDDLQVEQPSSAAKSRRTSRLMVIHNMKAVGAQDSPETTHEPARKPEPMDEEAEKEFQKRMSLTDKPFEPASSDIMDKSPGDELRGILKNKDDPIYIKDREKEKETSWKWKLLACAEFLADRRTGYNLLTFFGSKVKHECSNFVNHTSTQ